MQKPKGKQATKGQKEIFTENLATIKGYGAAALVSSGLYLVAGLTLWQVTQSEWVWWTICFLFQLIAVFTMRAMAKASVDERGHVLDAGLDLNDPGAFGEYCKDTIILTTITQIVALYTSYGYLCLLAVPAFCTYKIVFSVLIPWASASSAPSNDEVDDKKMRKAAKVKYSRAR